MYSTFSNSPQWYKIAQKWPKPKKKINFQDSLGKLPSDLSKTPYFLKMKWFFMKIFWHIDTICRIFQATNVRIKDSFITLGNRIKIKKCCPGSCVVFLQFGFYSACTYTQTHRLDLTISTQKSVWKTTHPGSKLGFCLVCCAIFKTFLQISWNRGSIF